MSANIAFTDSVGAASLSNGMPAPGDRFANWTPDRVTVDARDIAFGTGATFSFLFRTDYVAAFDLPYLLQSKLTVAMRLKAWLEQGGQVTVTTNDADSASYTAILRPGTSPTITLTDRALMEYTMHLELKNTAASPMTVNYGPVS